MFSYNFRHQKCFWNHRRTFIARISDKFVTLEELWYKESQAFSLHLMKKVGFLPFYMQRFLKFNFTLASSRREIIRDL